MQIAVAPFWPNITNQDGDAIDVSKWMRDCWRHWVIWQENTNYLLFDLYYSDTGASANVFLRSPVKELNLNIISTNVQIKLADNTTHSFTEKVQVCLGFDDFFETEYAAA